MERLLKRVETSFSGSVLGNSLEERLDYEYIAHLEHIQPNLNGMPNELLYQAEKWLDYLVGVTTNSLEEKERRNIHLFVLLDDMASGTLTSIYKNMNPPKPGEPMPPRPRMHFDLLVAEAIGEDLSDALCSELNGEVGDGANPAKRRRLQEHPVTQTPVIASDISPGDTNSPSMPAEKEREGHDHGRSNTDVRPDAEGEVVNSIHSKPVNRGTFNHSVVPTEQNTEGRNEGLGRKNANHKAKGDLIKAKGRREESDYTDTRVSAEFEVVSSQLSPPKNPGTSYRSCVPAKRKTESWDEENGYKNGNLNAKRFVINARHIDSKQADGFNGSDGKRIAGESVRRGFRDIHFHGEGDVVYPVNVVNERIYSGNYRVLPSERKGIKRKNEIDGDCLPFHGNDKVIDARHFLPDQVHEFDNSDIMPKKKKLCINTQMECNDTFGRGEGDLSKPMYVPERADAQNNPFMLAQDDKKELDSTMDCDSHHLNTEGDAMNPSNIQSHHLQEEKIVGSHKLIGCNHAQCPDQEDFSNPICIPSERVDGNNHPYMLPENDRQEWDNRMDRENQYHHIDGDVKNEKHLPSKQPTVFQHPYEPADQMEFGTHGMDAMNARFQAEYDFGYLCQHEPTEEWEEREGAMPGDSFAADPPAPIYLRSAIYQRHSSENTNSMDYSNAWEGGERRYHSHTIVFHPWMNETSTNAEQDIWEECW
ncbi:uncharacterized protein LOC124153511 [Ischnura elegans]|uniref:uncharacterized protein LOC124153511 n=1 Tax=Ischnura elegans TaxID=197161 RepID=UPI001ED8BE7D|nr:uncharacterized protein LOC124153511 [Ischnura elegans]